MLETLLTKVATYLILIWTAFMSNVFGYIPEGGAKVARQVVLANANAKTCKEWRKKYPDLDLDNSFAGGLIPLTEAQCPRTKKP